MEKEAINLNWNSIEQDGYPPAGQVVLISRLTGMRTVKREMRTALWYQEGNKPYWQTASGDQLTNSGALPTHWSIPPSDPQ